MEYLPQKMNGKVNSAKQFTQPLISEFRYVYPLKFVQARLGIPHSSQHTVECLYSCISGCTRRQVLKGSAFLKHALNSNSLHIHRHTSWESTSQQLRCSSYHSNCYGWNCLEQLIIKIYHCILFRGFQIMKCVCWRWILLHLEKESTFLWTTLFTGKYQHKVNNIIK